MKQIKSRSSICWPLLWENVKIEIGFKRGLGRQQRHRKTKVQIVTIPWMRIFIRQATLLVMVTPRGFGRHPPTPTTPFILQLLLQAQL